MTFAALFKLVTPLIIVALWAPYIQTIGHVWLFVSVLVSGVMGLKLAVPHAWLLLVLVFVWWGLFSSYNMHVTIIYINLVIVTVLGRNPNLFYNT